MSKKKPAFSVEQSLAGIAKTVHELREEGESTDRMVVVTSRGLAALTARVEELERESTRQSLEIFNLRKPARTWFQFLNGE